MCHRHQQSSSSAGWKQSTAHWGKKEWPQTLLKFSSGWELFADQRWHMGVYSLCFLHPFCGSFLPDPGWQGSLLGLCRTSAKMRFCISRYKALLSTLVCKSQLQNSCSQGGRCFPEDGNPFGRERRSREREEFWKEGWNGERKNARWQCSVESAGEKKSFCLLQSSNCTLRSVMNSTYMYKVCRWMENRSCPSPWRFWSHSWTKSWATCPGPAVACEHRGPSSQGESDTALCLERGSKQTKIFGSLPSASIRSDMANLF